MRNFIIAKLFKNGNSQAVRLPKEFRFEGNEVLIHREGNRVILQPRSAAWEDFFFADARVSPDFMQTREDQAPQKRDLF